uniref:RabBD domain-containing protein n=1 Tax=Plectus sambesii TaxID=2011161 RepID=A0A914XLZ2_9BILA
MVENLTADERRRISRVLERDVQLQRQEEQRILFARLAVNVYDNDLRDKAKRLACKKTNDQAPLTDALLARTCARCGVRLGYLSNTGDQCACCQERICTKCVRVSPSKKGGIMKTCQLCHLNRELKAISGSWLTEQTEIVPPLNQQPSTALLSQLKKIDSSRSPSLGNPSSARSTPRKKPPPKLRKMKRNQTVDTIPNQLLQKVLHMTSARRSSEPKSLTDALMPNKLEMEDKVRSLRKLTDANLFHAAADTPNGRRESIEYRSSGSLCPLRETSVDEPAIESNNNLVTKRIGGRGTGRPAPPMDPIALMREEDERDEREEARKRKADLGGLIGKLNLADTTRRMSAPAEHLIAQIRGVNGKRVSIARLLPYN